MTFPNPTTKIKARNLPPIFAAFNNQIATVSDQIGKSGETVRCDFAQGSLYLSAEQFEVV